MHEFDVQFLQTEFRIFVYVLDWDRCDKLNHGVLKKRIG